MKKVLFLVLASAGWGAPLWVDKGYPIPAGLVQKTVAKCCGSMRPTLKGGETVWVEMMPTYLQVGDIVAVDTQNGPVLHRITAMNSRAIYTSGDNNPRSDGWTEKSRVWYVVRYIERPANSVHLSTR